MKKPEQKQKSPKNIEVKYIVLGKEITKDQAQEIYKELKVIFEPYSYPICCNASITTSGSLLLN